MKKPPITGHHMAGSIFIYQFGGVFWGGVS